MDRISKDQGGFSAVEALLIILVLAVIGFGGYFVWHKQQNDKSTKTETSTTNSNPTPTPSSNSKAPRTAYFTIASQNVRLPLIDELTGLKPGTVEDSSYSASDKSVAVLAPQLDGNWTCAADSDGNKGTIGMISITTQAKRSGPGEPAVSKKIGTYTYGFEPGGSNCTSDTTYSELVSAFEKQFSALESY